MTNPPFSLFRDFISLMVEHNKKFIVLGNMNAITYKEIFPLIKENRLWLGVTGFNRGMYFNVPEDFEYRDSYKFEREIDGKRVSRVAGVCWFTNLEHEKRNYPIDLYKRIDRTPEDFPEYDNYNAIEVSRVADIPEDYTGVMGVPITFIGRHCPEQFEILGMHSRLKIEGKNKYDRILIKNKNPSKISF